MVCWIDGCSDGYENERLDRKRGLCSRRMDGWMDD